MNIKQAKEQIQNAMTAYFSRDEFGNYIMPIEKQRPIFLMGPPGVGKTAIMEQVASELGVGLISYSMTHHTRQSALGLPFIVHKNYGGKECDVSEYTMSEIVASVYDMMEETGVKEGILFLDEINCVSETLSPIMLQFLQYKIFGKHKVPDGWLVVTAGNPPEYNNSVREFDIVTWDRLKRVDVEPDFDVWKEYAHKVVMHPSILTYLEIKKSNFYKVESTIDGKSFVTARGWDDLSQMIKLYEKNNIKVDENLICQYLQNKNISKDFAVYYDLFNKYRSDYQVDTILDGKANQEIKNRAINAKFDERLSLLGLILDAISGELRDVMSFEEIINDYMQALKNYKLQSSKANITPAEAMEQAVIAYKTELAKGKKSGTMNVDKQRQKQKLIEMLHKLTIEIQDETDADSAFKKIKKSFDTTVRDFKKKADVAGKKLSNVFVFCEEVFGDGQEMLVFVTELTINYHTAKFINKFGCKEYFNHNKDLLFYDRQKEIIDELESLNLD